VDDGPLGDFLWPTWTAALRSGLASQAQVVLGIEDLWKAEALIPDDSRGSTKSFPRFEPIDFVELIPQRIPLSAFESQESTVSVSRRCGACGALNLEVDGVEDVRTRYKPAIKTRVIEHNARKLEHGLFLRTSDVPAPLFGIKEAEHYLLGTDDAKIWLEDQSTTNVTFLNYGEVVG
jgi:hypothetical protein